MLTVFLIIITLLAIEQGFTVSINEGLSLYDNHIYSRSLDTLYRMFRVIGGFLLPFTIVHLAWLLLPIILWLIAYGIKQYWLLHYKY